MWKIRFFPKILIRKNPWQSVFQPVGLVLPIFLFFSPLSTRGVSEWSYSITVESPQGDSSNNLEEIHMFAFISELISWSVGPSLYGVTEVPISFNFTMYNRMEKPQVLTWANSCEFAPSVTTVLEVENLTFSSYYGSLEFIMSGTYPPGSTNRSWLYHFCLSEPGYTELPSGSYHFDILDYSIPSFPTFGVTLIINETGSFRIYDEIPSWLFSPLSEPQCNETSSNLSNQSSTSFVSSSTQLVTYVDDWDTSYEVLSLIVTLMLLIPFRRKVTAR
ncbi:MAG: hypothetical protein ACFFFH_15650 [Candidatus Thorarchaeota archaeon]